MKYKCNVYKRQKENSQANIKAKEQRQRVNERTDEQNNNCLDDANTSGNNFYDKIFYIAFKFSPFIVLLAIFFIFMKLILLYYNIG